MSRLIDADVFAKNVVKYSHQSTKTIGQALADTPTVKAVPIEVLREIRAEIQKPLNEERFFDTDNAKSQAIALNWCLEIIDKHLKDFNA